MKTIYVVRHGKAVARDSDVPDFERSLVDKGEKNSVKVAQFLKDMGVSPDLFISSPANRALETAKVFSTIFGHPEDKILLEKGLYDKTNSKYFFSFLKKTDDEFNTLIIFGHEPTISGFITELVPEYSDAMVKSGIAEIGLPINRWSALKPGIGILKLLLSPGKSKKVRTTFRQVIQKRLENQALQFLESVNPETTAKILKTIKQANAEITKKFMNQFLG